MLSASPPVPPAAISRQTFIKGAIATGVVAASATYLFRAVPDYDKILTALMRGTEYSRSAGIRTN